jgi:Flp pilus assembly protein TadD
MALTALSMALDEPKLRKLVAIDPNDPLSRFALGRKLAESDETLEEAVEHLQFANAHAADHLATYNVLSDALIRLGRFDEARAVLTAGIPRADAVGEGMGRDLAPALRKMLDAIAGR